MSVKGLQNLQASFQPLQLSEKSIFSNDVDNRWEDCYTQSVLSVLRYIIHLEEGGDGLVFIQINLKSSTPLYEQIIEQVKELIARGIVEEGEQLPSVRDLASQVVLNPNTVSKAYKELERQGVIVTVRGKGTFVANAEDRLLDPKQLEQVETTITTSCNRSNIRWSTKGRIARVDRRGVSDIEGRGRSECRLNKLVKRFIASRC